MGLDRIGVIVLKRADNSRAMRIYTEIALGLFSLSRGLSVAMLDAGGGWPQGLINHERLLDGELPLSHCPSAVLCFGGDHHFETIRGASDRT